ncbi:hypothetical protein L873DRAFT_1336280 [Choiromyces venosus 120613-1]|uniref:Uncharacterized protein n=1 Tax=Choiromyces venosus 120613-1 TaxID=1336337 RepID=A0A3N4J9Y6_9PEZI|nr:hypothetical protein L873DRAFT_1336280 [Choiromyces venosus 120613-1]
MSHDMSWYGMIVDIGAVEFIDEAPIAYRSARLDFFTQQSVSPPAGKGWVRVSSPSLPFRTSNKPPWGISRTASRYLLNTPLQAIGPLSLSLSLSRIPYRDCQITVLSRLCWMERNTGTPIPKWANKLMHTAHLVCLPVRYCSSTTPQILVGYGTVDR